MRTLFNTGCFVLAFLLTCVFAVACDDALAGDWSDNVGRPRDTDFEIDYKKPVPRGSGCALLQMDPSGTSAVVPVYAPGVYDKPYAALMVVTTPGVKVLTCKGPVIWFQQDGEES